MSPELFPIAAVTSESPRTKWIKKHFVRTWKTPANHDDTSWKPWASVLAVDADQDTFEAFQEEVENSGGMAAGYGNTEDEAIADLATKHGLPLWNEEREIIDRYAEMTVTQALAIKYA